MAAISNPPALEQTVRQAVAEVKITDIHTHLFPPTHGDLLLWGVDELLTYHYLVAELFTVAPRELTPREVLGDAQDRAGRPGLGARVPRARRAERGPPGRDHRRSTSSAWTSAGRDLAGIRKWFAEQEVEELPAQGLRTGRPGLRRHDQQPVRAGGGRALAGGQARAWTASRPPCGSTRCSSTGRGAAETHARPGLRRRATPNDKSFAEARRFLADWATRIDPVYMAASLPPDFAYPADDTTARGASTNVILPAARELNLPMAMMIGVRKQVNPGLGDGGDAVGIADVDGRPEPLRRQPRT